MAYTGTGTQADPFIPTTITSLYDILDTCNADTSAADMSYYIKLTADLDCANDPDYIGYMDHGIYIGAKIASLYTDTNKKIIGLTVKGTYFIKTDADENHVRTPYAISNIEFKNCFFKATTTSAYCLDLYTASYSFNNNALYNVKVSLYVYRMDGSTLIQGSDRSGFGSSTTSYLEKCSFYFCLKDTYYSPVSYSCQLNYCNVIVDGSSITGAGVCRVGNTHISCIQGPTTHTPISYTSFIFKNLNVLAVNQYGSDAYGMIQNASYSYLACIGCTFTQNVGNMDDTATLSHCLIAADDFGQLVHSDTINALNYISISDLQNNQTLLDLGFLP